MFEGVSATTTILLVRKMDDQKLGKKIEICPTVWNWGFSYTIYWHHIWVKLPKRNLVTWIGFLLLLSQFPPSLYLFSLTLFLLISSLSLTLSFLPLSLCSLVLLHLTFWWLATIPLQCSKGQWQMEKGKMENDQPNGGKKIEKKKRKEEKEN